MHYCHTRNKKAIYRDKNCKDFCIKGISKLNDDYINQIRNKSISGSYNLYGNETGSYHKTNTISFIDELTPIKIQNINFAHEKEGLKIYNDFSFDNEVQQMVTNRVNKQVNSSANQEPRIESRNFSDDQDPVFQTALRNDFDQPIKPSICFKQIVRSNSKLKSDKNTMFNSSDLSMLELNKKKNSQFVALSITDYNNLMINEMPKQFQIDRSRDVNK